MKAYSIQKCDEPCNVYGKERIYQLVICTFVPLFISFKVSDITIKVTPTINFFQNTFKLIGIIYFGNFHFTSRIIDNSGNIWYNDSIETGQRCRKEDNIN